MGGKAAQDRGFVEGFLFILEPLQRRVLVELCIDGLLKLLLSKLKGLPPERRGAHFTCAVVVARPNGSGAPEVLFQAEEKVDGRIAEEPRGGNGFGYDPIFFFPPYGCTFGEVVHEKKDRVSHRGKAFARLRAFLESARL